MRLATAIKHLKAEYKMAKRLNYVLDPLAWALFKVWKMAARAGKERDDRE